MSRKLDIYGEWSTMEVFKAPQKRLRKRSFLLSGFRFFKAPKVTCMIQLMPTIVQIIYPQLQRNPLECYPSTPVDKPLALWYYGCDMAIKTTPEIENMRLQAVETCGKFGLEKTMKQFDALIEMYRLGVAYAIKSQMEILEILK